MTVYTSTQGQFAVRDQLAKTFDMPVSKVIVEAQTFGGGFGAKYGVLEPLVAAAALAVRQPVRIVLTRSEDMMTTTPAPEMLIDLKTGADKDGMITAIEAAVYSNNGIFSYSHSPIAAYIIGGNYACDNVSIDAYEVHTNTSQVGAYRAPAVPQATFALESNVDEMRRKLGIDPVQFRLQNAVEGGGKTGVGRVWPTAGYKKCLNELAQHPILQTPLGENEGIGIAGGGWPVGVTNSEAVCRVDIDGFVHVQTGNVDVTGNKASFALVAAEILDVNPDNVIVENTNTTGGFAPHSGGSQVTYSVAGSVRRAAESVKAKLLSVASNEFEAAAEDIELVNGKARVKGVPDKGIDFGRLATIARQKREGTGPIVGEGTSTIPENAPAFCVHAVKVHVDPQTGVVTVLDHVAVQDVGFAINPLLVEGQMHGGMLQGLGIGLHEAMIYDDEGQLLSGTLLDYGMPRFDQAPNMQTVMVENPSPHGPFGARGVGEPPIIPGAAATANAVFDATGVRMTQMPMRQETVWRALRSE